MLYRSSQGVGRIAEREQEERTHETQRRWRGQYCYIRGSWVLFSKSRRKGRSGARNCQKLGALPGGSGSTGRPGAYGRNRRCDRANSDAGAGSIWGRSGEAQAARAALDGRTCSQSLSISGRSFVVPFSNLYFESPCQTLFRLIFYQSRPVLQSSRAGSARRSLGLPHGDSGHILSWDT